MTPLQKRLLALGRTLGVPLTTLEKDVALGALLAAVAADSALGEALIFKGGTAPGCSTSATRTASPKTSTSP